MRLRDPLALALALMALYAVVVVTVFALAAQRFGGRSRPVAKPQ